MNPPRDQVRARRASEPDSELQHVRLPGQPAAPAGLGVRHWPPRAPHASAWHPRGGVLTVHGAWGAQDSTPLASDSGAVFQSLLNERCPGAGVMFSYPSCPFVGTLVARDYRGGSLSGPLIDHW